MDLCVLGRVDRGDLVRLDVLALPAPEPFVGKTLGEANIGTLLELNVLG